MKEQPAPQLYKTFFIDKSDERRVMFQIIEAAFHPERGIYPGSFVHITPSFFIKSMTYVDMDKRLPRFFKDDRTLRYIDANNEYTDAPNVEWFQSDYSSNLGVEKNSFDSMFSFYAGFISPACKGYLKDDGVLICNNSHGDASIAYTDSDYILVGAIKRSGDNFKLVSDNLSALFKKKNGHPIDIEKVLETMTGEKFTKKAYAYVFRYQPCAADPEV